MDIKRARQLSAVARRKSSRGTSLKGAALQRRRSQRARLSGLIRSINQLWILQKLSWLQALTHRHPALKIIFCTIKRFQWQLKTLSWWTQPFTLQRLWQNPKLRERATSMKATKSKLLPQMQLKKQPRLPQNLSWLRQGWASRWLLNLSLRISIRLKSR